MPNEAYRNPMRYVIGEHNAPFFSQISVCFVSGNKFLVYLGNTEMKAEIRKWLSCISNKLKV